LIKNNFKDSIVNINDFKIINSYIGNMKFYYKLHECINQEELKDLIIEKRTEDLAEGLSDGWKIAVFNSNNYYAVKARLQSSDTSSDTSVKISFFRTGTISINCKRTSDISKSFDEINKLITETHL
jgi:hypothetical protein